MTAQETTNGVLGCLRIVGMLRSKAKWPKNMIAYASRNSPTDQSGRNGSRRTAAAIIGQPTPTCRK